MSMTDPAAESAESADLGDEQVAPEPTVEEPQIEEPQVEESKVEVTLQRSVRVGRVIVGAAILGALVAALLTLFFPIDEKADYTMGQVMGFMALIGAAIGLGVGGLIALMLGAAAKRRRGTGVAIQSDVR